MKKGDKLLCIKDFTIDKYSVADGLGTTKIYSVGDVCGVSKVMYDRCSITLYKNGTTIIFRTEEVTDINSFYLYEYFENV